MKVVYSQQAKNDLHDIYAYIRNALQSPENAAGITERIMKEIRSLETMPERNPLYTEEPWKSKGMRYTAVQRYMIFYMMDKEAQTVSIIRVMYGGRDISRQL